jgi:hypothetical protein
MEQIGIGANKIKGTLLNGVFHYFLFYPIIQLEKYKYKVFYLNQFGFLFKPI